jgi:ribosomal 30S subunit maturation factor RimM
VTAKNFYFNEEQGTFVATSTAKQGDLKEVLMANQNNASKLSARLQRESAHRDRSHNTLDEDDSFWHDISDLSVVDDKRHQGNKKRTRETLNSKSSAVKMRALDSYFSKRSS